MKNQWFKVQQEVVNKPQSSSTRGVKVQVMVSPSDVPSAVRSFMDDANHYVIEFKYLSSPEKSIKKRSDNGVEIHIGKNSKKIYLIKVDCDHVMRNSGGKLVLEMILEAEYDISRHSECPINSDNKNVINNIFNSQYSQSLGLA